MTRIREVKLQRAKDYILAHPDESKTQQAIAIGCSESYIGLARKALIAEGKLAPSRKQYTGHVRRIAPQPAPPPGGYTAADAATTLPTKDSAAMAAMAAAADALSDDEMMDDEVIYKKFLRQCISFAMNPELHPDTRMSAQQMWLKFRDNSRVKDLGPGAPMTFEDGTVRLMDMHEACGPEMVLAAIEGGIGLAGLLAQAGAERTLAAVNAAYQTGGTDAGKVSADADQAAPGAAGASGTP